MAASISLLAIVTLILFGTSISTDPPKDGFSVDLISLDFSPESPFYNPNETHFERVVNAHRRSMARLIRTNRIKINDINFVVADIISIGTYLMRFSIGTPPFPVEAIADTGSDLLWVQCQPCTNCFEQNAPIWNPESTSSSFGYSLCSTQGRCDGPFGEISICNKNLGICEYSYDYKDDSYSRGRLSIDAVTLSTTTGAPYTFDVRFGCGSNSHGNFNRQSTGIIGLGGGQYSFVSQMAVGGWFSYCLLSPLIGQAMNRMYFGAKSIVNGPGLVTTPLYRREKDLTYYYLTLEGISVENNRINFLGSSYGTTEGNIVIDSGSILSYLPEYYLEQLIPAVEAAIPTPAVPDPSSLGLRPCYDMHQNISIPQLTAHFQNNADLTLLFVNIFTWVSKDIFCLAFKSTQVGAIYGAIQQINFFIGFELVAATVAFRPADCTLT